MKLLVLRLIGGALAVAGVRCTAISISTAIRIPPAAAAATAAIRLRATFLAPEEAKVCDAGVLGLGREAVAIDRDLQGADIHAVELHVRLSLVGDLLLRWHVPHLHARIARALDVELDELGGATMESVDSTDSSFRHELHGVAVSGVAGGVLLDSLDGGLEVGEEPLVQLPLDAQHPPPGKEGDLRLCVLAGHAALMEDDVDLVLVPLGIGVDGVPTNGVDGEARRSGALLLLGRSINDNRLIARRLLACLLGSGCLLLGGGGGICHLVVLVLLVLLVDVVVGGVLVVVVVVVVVLVVVTVVVVVVVCNLESRGRNVSNSVNNMKNITIIHYLLVDGTHSECPRALAIGRSCESCDES